MRVGYKRTLVPEDLYKLNEDIKVEAMEKKFQHHYLMRLEYERDSHVLKKTKKRGETPLTSSKSLEEDMADFKPSKWSIVVPLFKTFWLPYSLAITFLILASLSNSVTPLLTKKLIAYVELRALGLTDDVGSGVGYAIGCSLLVFVSGVLMNHTFQNSMSVGARTKAVLTKALLHKSFLLNGQLKYDFPMSKITSMMGTDLARIDFALGFQPFIVAFPFPIAISIGILCHNIGASALVGIGVMFLFIFVMFLITKTLIGKREEANTYTDMRVNYVKQVLTNLKMIKFYSWEQPYFEKIADSRNKEMKIVYRIQVARNFIISVAMSLTLFASMGSFLVLYATRNSTQDPASIFSSVSLFNSLTQQVFLLPVALSAASDAAVGVGRIADFLASGEIDKAATNSEPLAEMRQEMEKKDLAIKADAITFKWDKHEKTDDGKSESDSESNEDTDSDKASLEKKEKDDLSTKSGSPGALEATIFESLRNVNLEIKNGEFIAITGLIGTGKTSLLNGLAGFMNRTEGELGVLGSLLLCGTPWIQNATVKENILFGNEFDEKKYKEIIYACSLESDLKILPAGDETEIGERGITLSGGQKARINLARAVYADSDIILLDDVLSAVDARVGKHIMNTCLMGLLQKKTRILATHQLSLIGDVDRVIFLNGDGTVEVGTLETLKENVPAFKALMAYNADTKKSGEEEEGEEDEREMSPGEEKEFIEKQLSRHTTNGPVDEEAAHYDYDENRDADGRLIAAEGRSENRIKFEVLKNYVRFGSGIYKHWSIIPVIMISTALAVFCQLFTNTWLSFWTELKFAGRSNGFYIGLYVMFTCVAYLLLTLEFVVVAYMTNTAATVLNIMAVKEVLRVPMAFMDTTPMGRILNRFTKDTDTLDNEMGNEVRMLIFFFSNIIGVIVLCIIYLPWFAIAVPFLVFIFISISNFYQASAREIKRLEAVQRSLVYNNFNETLSGMDTIKAYKREVMFLSINDRFIDQMNEAYYITIANQRWLAIHLDCVATAFAILIAFLCVFRVFDISAASVGLLLSYVLQIAGQLSFLVRMYTQVENELNSVERISEYAFELPKEAPAYISETAPPESWPASGLIRFENVSMAYRPELPLVLKKLNFQVKPMEKIGVCGRTGAGKSSIMTALFRLSELNEGKIEIDGLDISKLGLLSLRSKLSIIPQDPVLFQGTIRSNLDPFGDSSDEELWTALLRAGIIDSEILPSVKAQNAKSENLHKFHLSREVEDDGANFSLGERQLISFARALVRGSKILILDEATSSVDYETDSKIQTTIRSEFDDCTILCIAHRLKTILTYDRILVLDKGEIVEYDTPWNLFTLKDSIFQQMCLKSNITEDDFNF